MKPCELYLLRAKDATFSILERIDVGETPRGGWCRYSSPTTFSILERIDVGETHRRARDDDRRRSFSILERIDVGET